MAMGFTALFPFLLIHETREIPALEEQVNYEEIERIKHELDLYKAEQIEQFIISVCDLRKVEGKPDIFPSNTDLSNLTYSDTTYNLGSNNLLTADGIKKSDGSYFTIESLSSETECDISDFVK